MISPTGTERRRKKEGEQDKGLLRIIGCDNDTENEREHKFIRQTVDYLDAEYFSILLKI